MPALKVGGHEVKANTHGGLPTYANLLMSKLGLAQGTINYLLRYDYPYDLIEKAAFNK